jgi:cation-transporting ATPase 13A2
MEIALRGLDLFTIAVPPALPLALTAGQFTAIKRMQKQNIFCISPPR